MLLRHRQHSIKLLGDPHLGRTFLPGVPLARRGEREAMVWADFERSLMEGNHDVHICMGDLFDKFSVPYDVTYRAIRLYKRAAKALSSCYFFVLRGNHDISLDLEKKGAFDVFKEGVEGVDNIIVVDEPMVRNGIGFFPWHPTRYADELLLPCEIALGHWDTVFGKANMIPTEKMAELGITRAYTGHVHKPEKFVRDGVDVTVVGSMQPYAHGEDTDDTNYPLYLTVTLEELAEYGRGEIYNRCVRVKLAPGETLDFEIDCLQLTVVRESEDTEQAEVTLGEFNLDELFTQAFDETSVPLGVRTALLDRYHQGRLSA